MPSTNLSFAHSLTGLGMVGTGERNAKRRAHAPSNSAREDFDKDSVGREESAQAPRLRRARRHRPMGASFGACGPAPKATFLLPLPALRRSRSKMAAAAASRVSGLLGRSRAQLGRPMSSGAHGEEGSGTRAGVGEAGLSPTGAGRGGTVTLA